MTNHDKSNGVPSRRSIAVSAVFLGVMAGFLIWLVTAYPRNPDWADRIGVLVYAILTGFWLNTVISQLRKRWTAARHAPVSPYAANGYLDCDGDRWGVQEDGHLALRPGDPGIPLEEVERNHGPLEPTYDCESCDGTGMSGRDPETNGRCWDCRGQGFTV